MWLSVITSSSSVRTFPTDGVTVVVDFEFTVDFETEETVADAVEPLTVEITMSPDFIGDTIYFTND